MPLIIPKKVAFAADTMQRMWKYVEEQVDHLDQEAAMFNTNTLPEWTRQLKGRPKQETKDFPFPNASNLVIQLIATRVEQMLSRAMTIYMVDPLWVIGATGDLVGQESDSQARVLEQFLGDMAIDPEELELYRQEELMWYDGIAYGTSFLTFPWQYITEQQAIDIPGATSGLTRKTEFKDLIIKDGPSPEVVNMEDILISNKVTKLEKAKFFARIVYLTREAIEDRIAFGVWSKADGEAILKNPYSGEQQSVPTTGATDPKLMENTGSKYGQTYRIYECHFKFLHDRQTFSIIAHYNKETKIGASANFNHYPKNMLPFEDIRFGYDSRSYRGYGFCEMLSGYQKEVSEEHNNRLDNETIRNNVTLRINKDSELASTLKWYPGVGIPADPLEVEVLDLKMGAIDNANSESVTISMANERSGIDPAISGQGSGVVNAKRGIYSSQGTMAVLQQQNNRTGLRMMDIRGTHIKIGRKLTDLYAHIGIGGRLKRYGAQANELRKALDSVRSGDIGLIVKASTGANNVESDRQNSILLDGLQQKYIATLNQTMMALQQPQIGDEQRQFLLDTMFAENALTRHIFRLFGHYDVDKLVPFPESIRNARSQVQPGNRGTQQSTSTVPSVSSQPANPIPTSPSIQ